MKQNYIKPETTVQEIEAADMLAASFLEYTDEKASNELEALSNDRRGSWGDLWD